MPKPPSSTEAARALAALRKVHRGGRPALPTPCPRCGQEQPSARAAFAHCRKKRASKEPQP